MAVSYQLPYIAEILLENGAEVNTQSATGQTPIMEAVLQGENVMVEMLTRYRADVTIPDHVSFPLVTYCIYHSNLHFHILLRSLFLFRIMHLHTRLVLPH